VVLRQRPTYTRAESSGAMRDWRVLAQNLLVRAPVAHTQKPLQDPHFCKRVAELFAQQLARTYW
jgi:hypothetical protein